MIKKILLLLIISFTFFTNPSFAVESSTKELMDSAKSSLEAAQKAYNENNSTINKEALYKAQTNYQTAKDSYAKSDESENNITSAGYKISVNDISPGMAVEKWNTVNQSINKTLGKIIQSMMVLLWSLALLIMTIGAWFMILHHGQDELLSKWKSIFMSWVYALIVALSSYYLIAIFRYILFTGNN